MIDTHSHIDAEEFNEDLDQAIQRAKDARIEKIFVPGICLKDTEHMLQVCKENKGYLYPMIGLHPENIMDEDYHMVLDKMEEIIERMANNPQEDEAPLIAIGEIGLDLYWDDTHEAEQIEVFERQIEWAEKYNLPLMLHVRKAHNQLMKVLRRHDTAKLSGVFHCFTGSEEMARDLLTFPNFMIGIGGVLTFKKAHLPEVVKNSIPISRIVLETDSPYMAPTPHRGKRNESTYVIEVAKKLSEIFDLPLEEIEQITTANALKIFPNAQKK